MCTVGLDRFLCKLAEGAISNISLDVKRYLRPPVKLFDLASGPPDATMRSVNDLEDLVTQTGGHDYLLCLEQQPIHLRQMFSNSDVGFGSWKQLVYCWPCRCDVFPYLRQNRVTSCVILEVSLLLSCADDGDPLFRKLGSAFDVLARQSGQCTCDSVFASLAILYQEVVVEQLSCQTTDPQRSNSCTLRRHEGAKCLVVGADGELSTP